MNFGTFVVDDTTEKRRLSSWNGSSFHIAISHRTNANEMHAWMPVVQALTHHPVIDWIGLQGQMHMQRTCFAKLIVGQSAALHLYNDHRLPPFPSSYPHPEFHVSGLCFVSFILSHIVIVLSPPFFAANIIRCIAIELENPGMIASSIPISASISSLGLKLGMQGPASIVVGLIGNDAS